MLNKNYPVLQWKNLPFSSKYEFFVFLLWLGENRRSGHFSVVQASANIQLLINIIH